MRYLGIDLGEKRTGLALGDETLPEFVSPLGVIVAPLSSDLLIKSILKMVQQQLPGALVIGLPINMDGTEGTAAKSVREFGEKLATQCKLPVHYQDERLTSYAADQQMNQSGRTHKEKKQLRDALAAAEILRDFFDGRR